VPGDDPVDRLAVTAAAGLLLEVSAQACVLGTAWQLGRAAGSGLPLCDVREVRATGGTWVGGVVAMAMNLRVGVALQAKA